MPTSLYFKSSHILVNFLWSFFFNLIQSTWYIHLNENKNLWIYFNPGLIRYCHVQGRWGFQRIHLICSLQVGPMRNFSTCIYIWTRGRGDDTSMDSLARDILQRWDWPDAKLAKMCRDSCNCNIWKLFLRIKDPYPHYRGTISHLI